MPERPTEFQIDEPGSALDPIVADKLKEWAYSWRDHAVDLERRLHRAQNSLVDAQMQDDLGRYKGRCVELEQKLRESEAQSKRLFDHANREFDSHQVLRNSLLERGKEVEKLNQELRAENERLRQELMRYESEIAAVCPEDQTLGETFNALRQERGESERMKTHWERSFVELLKLKEELGQQLADAKEAARSEEFESWVKAFMANGFGEAHSGTYIDYVAKFRKARTDAAFDASMKAICSGCRDSLESKWSDHYECWIHEEVLDGEKTASMHCAATKIRELKRQQAPTEKK